MSLALRPVMAHLRTHARVPLQVALYALLFLFSQWLVSRFSLPLPANIVGMLLLLALIALRILPLAWVKAGSRWLLAEMLLFFVPAVVAVVNYASLLMVEGWRIVAVIALSTLLTLGMTALVVDRIYRLELWLQRRRAGMVR
ncbi:CidA/LrgA family protein [Edwardsiella piscicida]|uniref:CidA/LrgA family protein n=1 Tax=Edwardsiella piscicida TaxID=1263550 RepID=UPI00084CB1F6|nr:CidA/LrgA family protein [Edwardsiella piscicida]AOP44337.1 CidA/LrgA family protein [Edwardsiella piscicida]EKS7767934.1 CidA/LrgA family protein [Edwardsiella piscicida]EKS7768464.1 CidA/LrgA family protein [Edwardsiella piscicida]EKS7794082.1 CidA/LrgA family protein [Edwardsiella piscicida]ELM3723797.1 CidA/LrgA family protein [Edwardsiella piscicida]